MEKRAPRKRSRPIIDVADADRVQYAMELAELSFEEIMKSWCSHRSWLRGKIFKQQQKGDDAGKNRAEQNTKEDFDEDIWLVGVK